MSYLKELAKVSGNEFANLVDDGIFGGDVEQFIDTGSYVFNALCLVQFMVDCPQTKSLQSQENLQLVKPSLHLDL